MSKCIIYCRFSDRRDSEHCQSNEMQRDACLEYCQQHGHEVVDICLDDAVSGAEEDRPTLWNAIARLKRGMVFVAYRADRLARSVFLHELIYRQVAKRGATVEIVSGTRNGDAAEDELMRTILAAFAAYERKVIAARTRAAALRHQANGIAVSKTPPYGKTIGPQREVGGKMRWTLIDAPDEQMIIASIVALHEEGLSNRGIARRLNARNVPARGKQWDHVIIGRIVARNGALAGNGAILVAQDRV